MGELRSLLLTDVVDSTGIAEVVGDVAMTAHWVAHDRVAHDLLRTWRGREIEKTDGLMAVFDSVADAAAFAADYHRALAALGLPFKARAGLHVGPITLRESSAADVAVGAKRLEADGLAVPITARVMGVAQGGQTLLTGDACRALGESKLHLHSHGYWRLKGVHDPIELFEADDVQSAFAPPADADKAYRVLRQGDLWVPVREVRNNLAPERDAFIGRSTELRSLARKIESGARLLTLLGTGGTGKTRIACRYAQAWLGEWPGGVAFCDLSGARSLDGIHFAVAFALGVPLGKDEPAVQLGHAIAGRGRCLVILDNFEQVRQHAAATVGHWLDRATDAIFVVTSRERLHLPGEEALPIEPLALDTDAIELFVARARLQRAGFELDGNNRGLVAEVVKLLDGLPLAIELAAARVRVLSPAQILERLQHRFVLLAGAHGGAARQATLRAAIDWSWELLAPWEQAALAQCSVFEGGFTLEAAEALLALDAWPDAPPAMDAVQALVDKSLVRSWLPKTVGRLDIAEPYFGMYLSIHEYAAEKLEQSGVDATRSTQERHGRYFARFGSDAALDALSVHGGIGRRQMLSLEIDNLVAACKRALQRRDAPIAVAAYRAAWQVLDFRGPFSLGVELGAPVLAMQEMNSALRVVALAACARASARVGRLGEATAWLAEALQGARQQGDRHRQGMIHGQLGKLCRERAEFVEAKEHLDAALQVHRELGNRRMEGVELQNLGILHALQNRVEPALETYDASLQVLREVGDRISEAMIHNNVGLLCAEQGRMDEARSHYDQALAIHRDAGNRSEEGLVLGNLGIVFFERGELEEARNCYEASLRMTRDVGNRRFEGMVLSNLGGLHFVQERIDEARANYEASLVIHREVGNRRSEGIVLSNLGRVHQKAGRHVEARRCYDESLASHRALGLRRLEGIVLCYQADLLLEQGDNAQARGVAEAAETALREARDRFNLTLALCCRGRVELAEGDRQRASATLAEVEAVATELKIGPASAIGHEVATLRSALA